MMMHEDQIGPAGPDRIAAHELAHAIGCCNAKASAPGYMHSADCDEARRELAAGRKPRVRVPAGRRTVLYA